MMENKNLPIQILTDVASGRGLLWEKISAFRESINKLPGSLSHKVGTPQSKALQSVLPLKHNFEGGLYTRELSLPKGRMIISMIHKQQHPSFLLKGKVSYIADNGDVKTISAPHTVFTQVGAQRVIYPHEDSIWACVYKTNATNVEDAELEIYVEDFEKLGHEVINEIMEQCQQ